MSYNESLYQSVKLKKRYFHSYQTDNENNVKSFM